MGGFRTLITLLCIANIKEISTVNFVDDNVDAISTKNGQPLIVLITNKGASKGAQGILLKTNKVKKLISLLNLLKLDLTNSKHKLSSSSDVNNEPENYVPDKTNKEPKVYKDKKQKNIGPVLHQPTKSKKGTINYIPDMDNKPKRKINKDYKITPIKKSKYAYLLSIENNYGTKNKNSESSQAMPDKHRSDDNDGASKIYQDSYTEPDYVDPNTNYYRDYYDRPGKMKKDFDEADSKEFLNKLRKLSNLLERLERDMNSKKDKSHNSGNNKTPYNSKRLDNDNSQDANNLLENTEEYTYELSDNTYKDSDDPLPESKEPNRLQSLLNLLTSGATKAKHAYHEITNKFWSDANTDTDHGLPEIYNKPDIYDKPDYPDYNYNDNKNSKLPFSNSDKSNRKHYESLFNLLTHGVTDYTNAGDNWSDDNDYDGLPENFNRPEIDSDDYNYFDDYDEYPEKMNRDDRKPFAKLKKLKFTSLTSLHDLGNSNSNNRLISDDSDYTNSDRVLDSDDSDYANSDGIQDSDDSDYLNSDKILNSDDSDYNYVDDHVFPEEYKEYDSHSPTIARYRKKKERKEALHCNLVLDCNPECLYKCN